MKLICTKHIILLLVLHFNAKLVLRQYTCKLTLCISIYKSLENFTANEHNNWTMPDQQHLLCCACTLALSLSLSPSLPLSPHFNSHFSGWRAKNSSPLNNFASFSTTIKRYDIKFYTPVILLIHKCKKFRYIIYRLDKIMRS